MLDTKLQRRGNFRWVKCVFRSQVLVLLLVLLLIAILLTYFPGFQRVQFLGQPQVLVRQLLVDLFQPLDLLVLPDEHSLQLFIILN